MDSTQTIECRLQACQSQLASRGQAHVLRFWDDLSTAEKSSLLAELEAVPWDVLDDLIPTHIVNKPEVAAPGELEPATVFPCNPPVERRAEYARAIEVGEDKLRAGQVAAMTVAGGQGSRLGFDGPKGMLPVTPVGEFTLFELFAQMVVAAQVRYATTIPWCVMTSEANHAQTLAYFESNDWFGLSSDNIFMFSQQMLPAFDLAGKLVMSSRFGLALAPNGHGGSIKALVDSGTLAKLKARGVSVISYFQVDNPLVKPFEPLGIGLHVSTGSEMAIKVIPKADDLERVGNVCSEQGRVRVVEYSDFPEALAKSRDADGNRRFDSGNAAIHLFDVAFVERVAGRSFQMPYRRAVKAVPYVDETGQAVVPTEPNAVKLETFVFDVLPLAHNPLVLEIDRGEEFSPVKNASGDDSLETAQRDLIARSYRWLASAGVSLPCTVDRLPAAAVMILPSFAIDASDAARRGSKVPAIGAGDEVLLQ